MHCLAKAEKEVFIIILIIFVKIYRIFDRWSYFVRASIRYSLFLVKGRRNMLPIESKHIFQLG